MARDENGVILNLNMKLSEGKSPRSILNVCAHIGHGLSQSHDEHAGSIDSDLETPALWDVEVLVKGTGRDRAIADLVAVLFGASRSDADLMLVAVVEQNDMTGPGEPLGQLF